MTSPSLPLKGPKQNLPGWWVVPPASRPREKCAYLAIYEGDAIPVASQDAYRPGVILPHCTPIPHFADSIITPREQDVGTGVGKGHSIHIIFMGFNLQKGQA